jgi:peptidoglycan/LPS O-acetylase OafA/YrhL
VIRYGKTRPGSWVAGIDSLRWIAALWVVLGHLGRIPVTSAEERVHRGAWLVQALMNNAFSGPAAVIVFFVISGFCIHRPSIGRPFLTAPFLARRFVRICGPMCLAFALWLAVGLPNPGLGGAIFWSLFCELVYYALYPLLRRAADRYGWRSLFFLTAIPAAWIAVTIRVGGDYTDSGPLFTWALGLPVWILGCIVAEAKRVVFRLTHARMWILRGAVWAATIVASVLRFHSPIKYPVSLSVFAIAAAFWLWCEIEWFSAHEPLRWLEKAGLWSYSVYLVHVPVIHVLNAYRPLGGHWWTDLLSCLASVLGASYIFGSLVERPFRNLARKLGTIFEAKVVEPKLIG